MSTQQLPLLNASVCVRVATLTNPTIIEIRMTGKKLAKCNTSTQAAIVLVIGRGKQHWSVSDDR